MLNTAKPVGSGKPALAIVGIRRECDHIRDQALGSALCVYSASLVRAGAAQFAHYRQA